jgi:hypothetical protein
MAGLIVALTLVEGGACFAATSGEPGEAKAIERTIRAQIAAFSRDDAPAAFAFATPAIQKTFGGDSDRFLRAVRESYPAVYRPTSLFFLPPKKGRESWVQVVNIADSDGKLWLAYYDMRRQADKTWKINGCELVETDTVAT